MGLVVSFADARAARVKYKLCAYAASRSPAMVETASEVIDARRIFCRDAVAVLIDRYGYQTKVGYADITDVSPILPLADIIAFAGFDVIERDEPAAASAVILPFPAHRA
jgi:hypothetical protein